jgi:hypothetical protein
MRTKTLLLTAALGAAGVASAVAQVYSVNAVGYVNTTAVPGYNLIANPLDAGAGNNTVAKLLTGVPDGSIVYTYSATGGFALNTLDLGEWTAPNATLEPGQGFFLRLSGAANVTVTFVGEVPQGTLSTPLVAGFNLVSSKVPQAGLVGTDLKLTVADGDTVYTFSPATGYTIYTFDLAAWDPSEPTIAVGQGIWVRKVAAGSWNRTFSVNNP